MSVACWGRGSVAWGSAVGGEVGAVGNIDVVPKLIRINLSWGWWSSVPVTPRIMIGGWGDGSGVVAQVESALITCESGISAR